MCCGLSLNCTMTHLHAFFILKNCSGGYANRPPVQGVGKLWKENGKTGEGDEKEEG